MEQTEEDIANDNITQETLNRQNQIIEHLLEAEKAEQERDKDKKREAKEATQLPHQVKELLEEYQKNKIKQSEMLKTIPAKLKPYYKNEKYLIKDKNGIILKRSESLNLLINKTSWNKLKIVK